MTAQNPNQRSLAMVVRSDEAQSRIRDMLGDNTQSFVTTLMSVVNQNIILKACEPWSVITAAITATSLDLPIEPSLGYADILPYWDNSDAAKQANGGRSIQKAQFQMRAKGFKQLAIRSGFYKFIHVSEVREGEYKGQNRLTGEHEFKWYKKDETRKAKKIIGYVSYFELLTGFSSTLYMTIDELEFHAKKYSKQYKSGGGQWADQHPTKTTTGFDRMARKTVMKLNISHNGVTSGQMQKALRADQAVANPDDTFDYVDNSKDAKPADNVDQTNPSADDGGNQEQDDAR